MNVSGAYMHYNASSCNPGIGRPIAFVVVVQQPIDKARGRFERRLRRVAVWRMMGVRQHDRFHRAVALFPYCLDLPERAVLVVSALHDQDRNADVTERFGDVPLLKVRIEPRPNPGAERAIDVGMPACEFFTQNTGGEFVAGAADRGKTRRLGEEMRGHEHKAAHPMILDAASVDRGDRGAVAVAEQNTALEADRLM